MFSESEINEFLGSLSGKVLEFKTQISNVSLIAHRGMGPTSILGATFDENYIPENTIRAFKRAMILGADGIELDIFKSHDDRIMVIHDDELYRNVYGADRAPPIDTTTVDKIGSKTFEQLSELRVGPSDLDKIPTLEEVFNLAKEANVIRASKDFAPIILNIEIKDATAIESCLRLIRDYIAQNNDSGVNFDSMYFCSFNHGSLIALKNLAKSMAGVDNIKIAPAIKTATLFGAANVNPDFTVKPNAQYLSGALDSLRNLVNDNGFIAYDAILWDIYQPLIYMAASDNKQLHASTSNHRNYEHPPEQCTFLIVMSESAPVYFKCDDVALATVALIKCNEPLDWDKKQRLLAKPMEKPTQAKKLVVG